MNVAAPRRRAGSRARWFRRGQPAPLGNLPPESVDSAARYDLSRERFEMALRAGRVGTWRWDIPGRVVDWDGPVQELFGYPPGTFPGTYEAYVARLHPDDRQAQQDGIDGCWLPALDGRF